MVENREFQGNPVEIKRRAFKRSIGVTLQLDGKILVTAPKLVPLSRIFQFLEKNKEWIQTNLHKYREIRDRYPRKEYREGEVFLFIGKRLTLHYVQTPQRRLSCVATDTQLLCHIPQDLWQTFDPNAAHPEIAEVISKFYEAMSRMILSERIDRFSRQMMLLPKGVSFRSQKTRWGSCSSRGKLSFNWKLIIAPLDVIDYVVIHEIAHLKFHDHSAKFWNLVAEFCPQYKSLKDWLKDHQLEADFLARKSELY